MPDNGQRPNISQRTWLVAILVFIISVIMFTNFGGDDNVKIYDCSVAEISPDYPIEVKEQCRKIHYEQWLKEQEKKRPISV